MTDNIEMNRNLFLHELNTGYGEITFRVTDNHAEVYEYHGKDTILDIPEYIDCDERRIPVRVLGRKAFMSNKYLREIHIPDSTECIQEWCFAYCTKLEKVYLHEKIDLEKDIFLGCSRLKQIFTNNINDKHAIDVSYLIVASYQLLKDKYLFDFGQSGMDEWIKKWDLRMDALLSRYDDEGFISLVAGGEEDYDIQNNTLEGYLSNSRILKVKICMVRLLHDYGLTDIRRKRLVQYLYEHRAGNKYIIDIYENGFGYSDNGYLGRTRTVAPEKTFSHVMVNSENYTYLPQDETWQVVLTEHGDEEEYYRLLCDTGCVDSYNIDVMLTDMDDKYARMKALLLSYIDNNFGKTLFDNMNL